MTKISTSVCGHNRAAYWCNPLSVTTVNIEYMSHNFTWKSATIQGQTKSGSKGNIIHKQPCGLKIRRGSAQTWPRRQEVTGSIDYVTSSKTNRHWWCKKTEGGTAGEKITPVRYIGNCGTHINSHYLGSHFHLEMCTDADVYIDIEISEFRRSNMASQAAAPGLSWITNIQFLRIISIIRGTSEYDKMIFSIAIDIQHQLRL